MLRRARTRRLRHVPARSQVAGAGNRDRLDRMLVNLIDNAVRYAKSSVTVSVGGSGPWVELAVTDDGPGIPEPDRERAFDRFARLDDARTRCDDDAGGAGLGLAIVRATAQSHAGTAHLESSPDGASGLRAVVRLPAATFVLITLISHSGSVGERSRPACHLRQRQNGEPVTYAIDIAYWGHWRSRQVAFWVAGVADRSAASPSAERAWPVGQMGIGERQPCQARCEFLPVADWEESGDGYGCEQEG